MRIFLCPRSCWPLTSHGKQLECNFVQLLWSVRFASFSPVIARIGLQPASFNVFVPGSCTSAEVEVLLLGCGANYLLRQK